MCNCCTATSVRAQRFVGLSKPISRQSHHKSRTVADCLSPGGHWLNVGPLNYVHDSGEPATIPLSWETLRSVILDSGFALLKESMVECAYCRNSRSMGGATFTCVFFVCQKK